MSVQITQTEFIKKIAPIAVDGGKKHRVCPSMTMAQAILESGWGKHCIGGYALFGVKGDGASVTTKEFLNGKWVTIKDSFETYSSYEDSFAGYYNFLERNPRYTKAGIFGDFNYRSACQKMQKAGYATAPQYAAKLIQLIEQYHLDQYDKELTDIRYTVAFTDISTRTECEKLATEIGAKGYKNHWIKQQ